MPKEFTSMIYAITVPPPSKHTHTTHMMIGPMLPNLSDTLVWSTLPSPVHVAVRVSFGETLIQVVIRLGEYNKVTFNIDM